MTELPTGTVTFLFTDIEGSTRLWEQHPQAMKAAVARHDAALRQSIAENRGCVVKPTGDGVHAVFDTARDGVAAAVAAQRALLAEPWADIGKHPLRVRMALHTGEAEVREVDYFGPSVNRAARLMSTAHGGQILLTVTTAELVQDQLPAGAALRDLGEHRLKDLVRPERIFQLLHPDLPAEFPPLRSLDAFPHNLPVQLTSFVGREREMAEVKRLLPTTRLLTLTGPGGTGKTRLALQVAADLLPSFADGVWLVELAPLSDPALVPQTVATMLGLREEPGRPWMTALADYLRPKRLLLILDNCEHLVEACAKLADALLHACPSLRLLASSREALGIAGEVPYRVPSLSLPDLRPLPPIETLSHYDAVRLFLERAATSLRDFALTSQNALAVAQVCHRLDGIPLAIELAAARVKMLQVEQIAARLDDRFRLLTGGSRTALPRQQTLRALIDWSYDLLAQPECALLRRLSVFASGWTLEAAEAVCTDNPSPVPSPKRGGETDVPPSLSGTGVGGVGPLDILDLLTQLANKSLVVAEREQGEETRYRLLETIRQYGRDKLLESGEAPAVRDRHLDYFLKFAEGAESKLEGREQVRWLDRLETEHDNLRAALEWAMERDAEAALQLAGSMRAFWLMRGSVTEGHRWFQEILHRFEALPPVQGEAARKRLAIRAKGLWGVGNLAFAHGDPAGRPALEKSVALAREAGEPRTLRAALVMLGGAWAGGVFPGDLEVAEANLEESIALSRAADDKVVLSMALGLKAGFITGIKGDFVAARPYLEESVRLSRELGNPWIAGMSLYGLGLTATYLGEVAEARARFEESQMLFREMGDRRSANMSLSELAHIERRLGHHEQALALYSEAIVRWQELGHRAAVAHQLECFAFIAGAQAHLPQAARLLGAAEALRESINSSMQAHERGEYDREVSALRARVDEATFAAAWADGRAMTMEQAIECALEKGEDYGSNKHPPRG